MIINRRKFVVSFFLSMLLFFCKWSKHCKTMYLTFCLNMNIIIITKISLSEFNVERRSLRTKIKKYLHQVKIVENWKTLKLLRHTIVLLTIDSSSQTINNKDSKFMKFFKEYKRSSSNYKKKMRLRFRNRRVTQTLWNASLNRSRCQNVSKNASRSSLIRKRLNKSKNSRSISSTTKKKRN
jgi:adenylate kinase family enzyme